ncbi:MAG: hypothetical protein H6627_11185 [Calditrichae bacterium]|nr:hypothetical protein [Calditrichota bacterium]MCB9059120.1 hypothetical protein [Calditrichia bacterium]
MPWSANFEKETDILITILDGICTLEDVQNAILYSLDFSRENGTKLFLVDCIKFQPVDTTPIVNAYSLGQFYEDNKVSHKIREAIVVPDNEYIKQNLQFFETTAVNRGYNVKTFESMVKARSWLLQKS